MEDAKELDYELKILKDQVGVQRDKKKWEQLLMSLYYSQDSAAITRTCIILSSTKNK